MATYRELGISERADGNLYRNGQEISMTDAAKLFEEAEALEREAATGQTKRRQPKKRQKRKLAAA